jgi:2-amino-4-hydroxy-6-hydroxymethyldihydropteridine diphosphokinase
MEAWIGLGSNLGKPATQLRAAIQKLEQTEGIELKRCSGFYRTAPWGNEDQDDFLNAVVVLDTTFQPHDLLKALLDIEQQMGRERSGEKWGPRCIDLDLLTYEDLLLKTTDLELPHPRMHLRAFVLQPLLELDPDFSIPGVGPAAACLSSLKQQQVEYIGSAD